MEKRPVTIYKLELLSWDPPFAEIFVHCSSGTYIRSLARDIALAAGSRAHLRELVRTQVAGFRLDTDLLLAETQRRGEDNEELDQRMKTNREGGRRKEEFDLFPIDKNVISALGMPWFEVTPQEAKHIFHGKPLDSVLDRNPLISHGGTGTAAETSSRGSPPAARKEKEERESTAIFCEETLIAVVEKIDGKWKYACVIPK
jgi:tRNA pseudouridine55 synthase